MLYNEFLEGTGAKDTDYNYTVYKNLEALYMANDNMTKQDVYKAAKNLIDNSLTEAEKKAEEMKEEARKQIKESEENIKYWKERIETMNFYIGISEPSEAKAYKENIKAYKEQIKKEKAWIARNKFYLSIA